MEGADESTELWRYHTNDIFSCHYYSDEPTSDGRDGWVVKYVRAVARALKVDIEGHPDGLVARQPHALEGRTGGHGL